MDGALANTTNCVCMHMYVMVIKSTHSSDLSALDNDTLVHVWKDKSTLDAVLTAGYKALLSNQNMWYLE